jgi:hypothetical protein
MTSEIIPCSKTGDLQAIIDAVNAHHPVIALIHGAVLNREIPQHPNYGDHWVVVRGFSADHKTVYVNDADYRTDDQLKRWDAGPAQIIRRGRMGVRTFRSIPRFSVMALRSGLRATTALWRQRGLP